MKYIINSQLTVGFKRNPNPGRADVKNLTQGVVIRIR